MKFRGLALLIFLYYSVCGQSTPFGFSLSASKGFVIPHRPVLNGLVTEHAHQIGFNLFQIKADTSAWTTHYGFVKKGINVSYISPGNNAVLGNIIATTAFVELPLGKKQHTLLKMGVGLGYISKPFEPQENFRNVAIGSHLNASLIVEFSKRVAISSNTLLVGIRLHHFSNGSFKTPNLGYNIPQINLGFEWATYPKSRISKPVFTAKKHYPEIIISAALKENIMYGGPKFGVFTVLPSYNWRLNYKTSLGGFAEYTINNSIPFKVADHQQTKTDNQQIALGLQAKLHFNTVQLFINSGVYIKNSDPDVSNFLSRLGLNYFFSKRTFATIFLKSHNFKADHIGVGIGHSFLKAEKK